jgi:hypothetical protein
MKCRQIGNSSIEMIVSQLTVLATENIKKAHFVKSPLHKAYFVNLHGNRSGSHK